MHLGASMTVKIRFISGNEHKIREAKEILDSIGVEVIPVPLKIDELQTQDTEKLIRDKAIKAFEQIGRPLFIEHTGLYLSYLNGLPGGLTQIFWDSLEADRFSELFGKSSDPSVVARTIVGYVDGKKIHMFTGEIPGRIATSPSGNRDFQWDCVFIPEGYNQTFADMGEKKNEISMRKRALDKFAEFLKNGG